MKRSARVAVTIVGCGVAAMASMALAANDPRGLDLGDDKPPPLVLGPGVNTPIPSTTEPVLRGNPLWGITLDSLNATRERPLFSPSRRPPAPPVIPPKVEPVKVAAPPPPPEQPPFNLLGVVAGSSDGYAVLINTTTHDIVRLRTGEGRDGWILQSVTSREAVLKKNQQTAVISLPATGEGKK